MGGWDKNSNSDRDVTCRSPTKGVVRGASYHLSGHATKLGNRTGQTQQSLGLRKIKLCVDLGAGTQAARL